MRIAYGREEGYATRLRKRRMFWVQDPGARVKFMGVGRPKPEFVEQIKPNFVDV